MLMDVFIKGDVYTEECDPTWSLYNDAIRTGKQIMREEYFRD